MSCLIGTFSKGPLDEKCPNADAHGKGNHSINSLEIIQGLQKQLSKNRDEGFQQLNLRGRTAYMIKALLLSHGYTVIIEATTKQREGHITSELHSYQALMTLQGTCIPVCLGMFETSIQYWYHGAQIRYMLVLSWSGVRLDHKSSDKLREFMEVGIQQKLGTLKAYGAYHQDEAWHNILWNWETKSVCIIDLEAMGCYRETSLARFRCLRRESRNLEFQCFDWV